MIILQLYLSIMYTLYHLQHDDSIPITIPCAIMNNPKTSLSRLLMINCNIDIGIDFPLNFSSSTVSTVSRFQSIPNK